MAETSAELKSFHLRMEISCMSWKTKFGRKIEVFWHLGLQFENFIFSSFFCFFMFSCSSTSLYALSSFTYKYLKCFNSVFITVTLTTDDIVTLETIVMFSQNALCEVYCLQVWISLSFGRDKNNTYSSLQGYLRDHVIWSHGSAVIIISKW